MRSLAQFRNTMLAGLSTICLSLPAFAQDAGIPDKATAECTFPKRAYSPYTQRNFPTRPYFGDTHLHTAFSMDAGAFVMTARATIMTWETTASGYAAVWANENTREALWDAMQRKETYATTGPRMIVRFFGGWDFAASDAATRSPAIVGYQKGVPMGGDLQQAMA